MSCSEASERRAPLRKSTVGCLTTKMVVFKSEGNSIFGITVDRKQTLKLLFPQEKATLHAPLKVYMYSENALIA